jgi:hypothetical protein
MRELVLLNIHLLPWKVLHALLMWELEFNIPFRIKIAPVILNKGLPRIIGIEVLILMSSGLLHLVSEPTLAVTQACACQVCEHVARRGTWVGTGRMDVSNRASSWPGADRRGRRSSKGGECVTSWPRA